MRLADPVAPLGVPTRHAALSVRRQQPRASRRLSFRERALHAPEQFACALSQNRQMTDLPKAPLAVEKAPRPAHRPSRERSGPGRENA